MAPVFLAPLFPLKGLTVQLAVVLLLAYAVAAGYSQPEVGVSGLTLSSSNAEVVLLDSSVEELQSASGDGWGRIPARKLLQSSTACATCQNRLYQECPALPIVTQSNLCDAVNRGSVSFPFIAGTPQQQASLCLDDCQNAYPIFLSCVGYGSVTILDQDGPVCRQLIAQAGLNSPQPTSNPTPSPTSLTPPRPPPTSSTPTPTPTPSTPPTANPTPTPTSSTPPTANPTPTPTSSSTPTRPPPTANPTPTPTPSSTPTRPPPTANPTPSPTSSTPPRPPPTSTPSPNPTVTTPPVPRPTAPCVCPAIFAPVCDPTTHTSYDNPCLATCAGAAAQTPGLCRIVNDPTGPYDTF